MLSVAYGGFLGKLTIIKSLYQISIFLFETKNVGKDQTFGG